MISLNRYSVGFMPNKPEYATEQGKILKNSELKNRTIQHKVSTVPVRARKMTSQKRTYQSRTT